MDQKKLKIGIVGGMGPMATLDLYEWIIRLTPAKNDQDHLPIIINNFPQIPDRTKYLLGEGEDPRPYLLNSAKLLEQSGAELLAIPCNTAHAFSEYIEQNLKTATIVNMLEETRKSIKKDFPNKNIKIGILATTGTIKTGLYQNYFKDYQVVVPSKEVQSKLVMEAIYGIKGIKSGYSKEARQLLRQAIDYLHKQGANIIVLGCTEISMVLRNEKNNGVSYINPVKILARSLVERSREHVS